MPLLHVTTFEPLTSTFHHIPNNGKTRTILLNLGLIEEHSLVVKIGDHIPQADAVSLSSSSSSSSSAAEAAATAGRKRSRRDVGGPLASQGGGNEALSLTIRYTPPTTRQDRKATRSVQQYHARTIREIETAMRNAKQARLELEAARNTTKTDLVTAALEIHLLTKELNRRRGVEELSFEQKKTHKWFLVRAGEPSRLVGVPGEPLVGLYGGDGVVDVTSLDKVVTKEQNVPLVPDPIEGKFIKEIALGGALPHAPSHVACHAGKAYVTHYEGDKISVLDVESGTVVDEWKIPGSLFLRGVAIHGEHVFVADASENCIRVLDMEGKQERQLGSRGLGNGQLQYPVAVAIAGDLLYACDSGNNRVQVFGLDGTWVRSWGRYGDGEGQFKYPSGITVHDDEVYVVDCNNHRVQVFDLDGRFRRMWGSEGSNDGEFNHPYDIIVYDDLVYVTDEGNNRLQLFRAADGGFVSSWGTEGSAAGELNAPGGLCVDDKDRMWVCDMDNRRVQVFR